MNIREELIGLDAAVNQVSSGVNAIAAMSRGWTGWTTPMRTAFISSLTICWRPSKACGNRQTAVSRRCDREKRSGYI